MAKSKTKEELNLVEVKNIKDLPYSPQKLTEALTVKLFDNYTEPIDFTFESIKEILNDTDVAAMINQINRTVAGYEVAVQAYDIENDMLTKDIEKRLNNIKFTRFIEDMLSNRFYGYSLFEMVYNPETYALDRLIFIPPEFVRYDTWQKKWVLNLVNNQGVEIDENKFLLCIHKWNPLNKMGRTILQPIRRAYLDKKMFDDMCRRVSKKYGDTIIIFGFDPNIDAEELKKKEEQLRTMRKGSLIGIPMEMSSADGKAIKIADQIHIIKLSDLKPELFVTLSSVQKERIMQYVLGGTLTMTTGSPTGTGGGSSFALGNVHEKSFQSVINECAQQVADYMQQIIVNDSIFFGYKANDFYIKLTPPRDLTADAELEDKKAVIQQKKLQNLGLLQSLGYELSIEEIAAILETDVKNLSPVTIERINEFAKIHSKKKSLLKIREEQLLDTAFKKSVKQWHKDFMKYLEDPLNNTLDLDFTLFEDHMFKAIMLGHVDRFYNSEFALEYAKGDEDNFFNLPYDRAIEYITNLNPALYEDIEKMQEQAQDLAIWVKRSTDLEATKKVQEAILKSLKNGTGYDQFLLDTENVADRLGFNEDNGWYSRLVYDQNLINAYRAADQEELDKRKEEYPYRLFSGVDDERQSEICRKYSGKIYKATDPIWGIITPPNHFLCRSDIVAMTAADVEGMKIEKSSQFDRNNLKKEMKIFADKISFDNNLKKLEKTVKSTTQKIKNTVNQIKNEAKIHLSGISDELEKINISFNTTSFAKLDGDWGYQMLKEIKDLNDEYPIVKKFNSGHGLKISITAKDIKSNAKGNYSYFIPDEQNPTLRLNKNLYSNLKNHITTLKEEMWLGEKMLIDEKLWSKYTIIHEWGHNLQDAIISTHYKKELNKNIDFEYPKRYYIVGEKIKYEILEFASKYDSNIKDNYKKYLSDYGQKNDFEFFAEIMTGLRGGIKNPLTFGMKDYLLWYGGLK